MDHEVDPLKLLDQITVELGIAHRQIAAQRLVIDDLTQQLLDRAGSVKLPGSEQLADVLAAEVVE